MWLMFLWVSFALMAFACLWFLGPSSHRKHYILFVFIPLLALLIYLFVGSPEIEGQPQAQRLAQNNMHPQFIAARIENKLAEHPNDAKAWQHLANIYLALGDLHQAREAYMRADHIQPNQADNLIGLAVAEILQNQAFVNQKALDWLQQARKHNPNDLLLLYWLAVAAQQDRRKLEAKKLFLKAQKIARQQKQKEWHHIIQKALERL